VYLVTGVVGIVAGISSGHVSADSPLGGFILSGICGGSVSMAISMAYHRVFDEDKSDKGDAS
jgi:hypothetical protein